MLKHQCYIAINVRYVSDATSQNYYIFAMVIVCINLEGIFEWD